MFRKPLPASIAASLFAIGINVATPSAHAFSVPAPCDFITGSGTVAIDDSASAAFAFNAGCKNGELWGSLVYADPELGVTLTSTMIKGYLTDPNNPATRVVCGWAETETGHPIFFRVSVTDGGQPRLMADQFGIATDDQDTAGERFYFLTTRTLASGNVKLHKSNPSTTASPQLMSLQEWQMCDDLTGENTP
jgi:hypothetical protein